MLAEGLRECEALAYLDVGQNEIGDEGAGMLAEVLGKCTALAHFDLGMNEIGAEGAGTLAAGLGECTALAHLSLTGNDIGAEGAGRLAAGLRESKFFGTGKDGRGPEGVQVECSSASVCLGPTPLHVWARRTWARARARSC
mmetsp:Transcript_6666/g.10187  ORF Transcript_6666/g.10187 Transcript_6666/m.10187 type:complete len:141 (+) Transcript_6666:165-587(+)